MAVTFSVVLPYYNESAFLEETLASWLAQERRPEQFVLVNNGSTDDSEAVAQRVLARAPGIDVRYLCEERPGKIFALQTGWREAEASFIAFSDADTYYPPHYLKTCEDLIRETTPEAVAWMAMQIQGNPTTLANRIGRRKGAWLSRLLPWQTFTGGCGQTIQTEALRRAGGFTPEVWRYVLLDHEVMNRLLRHGRAVYHPDLWCCPSPRRKSRKGVRWNLFERVVYHLTPQPLGDWYFYRFLGPRLARRGLNHQSLRDQPWQNA